MVSVNLNKASVQQAAPEPHRDTCAKQSSAPNQVVLPLADPKEKVDPFSPVERLKRVAHAAGTILIFHPFFKFPVSIAMEVSRCVSAWNREYAEQNVHVAQAKRIFKTGLEVASLASTLFALAYVSSALGVWDAFHGGIQDLEQIQHAASKAEVAKGVLHLSDRVVSLGLIAGGGVGLYMAKFGLKALISLVKSKEEFSEDYWIESATRLLSSGIRLNQGRAALQKYIQDHGTEVISRLIHSLLDRRGFIPIVYPVK